MSGRLSNRGKNVSRRERRATARQRPQGAKNAASKTAFASKTALTLGTLGAALAAVPAAQAGTFDVTNLNDAGAGSLRQAILDANALAGADTISFQAGLTGTITLTTGQLEIRDSVTITGPGASVITVDGNNASRVFYLYNGAAILDTTISGLTITGGNDLAGGGIITYDEHLTLDAVTITGNAATIDGGGIWADGFDMVLTIQSSTLSGNTAADDGGAIYVEDTGGTLTIQNTVITGNDAVDSGGGIYFYDPDADIDFIDSTISGNTAGGIGGGVYFYSLDAGTVTFQRTTISGNEAAAGGGIYFYNSDHDVVIENCTISGNEATLGPGGGMYFYAPVPLVIRHSTIAGNTAALAGGGIQTFGGEIDITNSIVGDNTAAADPDLSGAATFEVAFSLVETPGAATINDNGGNLFGQDPQLGALQNNGGPTETQKPAAASPVVNAGDPAFVPPPATDQRGFPRVVNGRLDMGAVELGSAGTIQLTFSSTNVAEAAGTVTVTATRTGGSEGAVSVRVDTADGTATSADYGPVAGTILSWADGDTAPKSLNITITNDLIDEPDETFLVTISAPTGGAALGSPTTATITIQDDDVPIVSVVEVPTLGEYGKVALMGLVSLAGLYFLRRRRGSLAAPALVLSLALAQAQPAEATKAAGARQPAETRAATLTQVTTVGQTVTIRLSDGSTLQVPLAQVEVKDQRPPRARRAGTPVVGVESLAAGQPVVLKVRREPDGSIRKVKVQVFDTLENARQSQQRKAP